MIQPQQQQIIIQNTSNIQLVGTKIKYFCIFSIRKPHRLTSDPNKFEDIYETFLLVKAIYNRQSEHNIVFVRMKEGQQFKGNIENQQSYLRSESYYSTFLRHVNLSYCRKLTELLFTLNVTLQSSIQNEWFMLYQVHNYKPQFKRSKVMTLKCPTYGSQVLVHHQSQEKQGKQKTQIRVSNLFRQNSQNFYFLSDLMDSKPFSNMQLITSLDDTQIIGLTYKINENLICVPFHSILFEKSCNIQIDQHFVQKLGKTCYVQFFGNYCTGILVEQKKVITTRHLLPLSNQKLSTKVLVRKFPYKQLFQGIVTKIGLGSLDLIEIQFFQNRKTKSTPLKYNQKNKQKSLVKYHLNHQSLLRQSEAQEKIKYIEKIKKVKTIEFNINKQNKGNYLVGDQILALGFGKFSYNSSIFSKMEIVLPTIASGIISKMIEIKGHKLFLKSDAKLYAGFSGSGLWKDSYAIAMAVFILKNKNSNSQYNRHNFSYTMQFMNSIRSKSKCQQMVVEFNKQMQEFDKIQMRKKMRLIQLPKAKL